MKSSSRTVFSLSRFIKKRVTAVLLGVTAAIERAGCVFAAQTSRFDFPKRLVCIENVARNKSESDGDSEARIYTAGVRVSQRSLRK